MKHIIIRLLLVSIAFSVILPSSAIAMARARQAIAGKLQDAQRTLDTLQGNVKEFGDCVLKGTCSSDKQKSLSTTLKASAIALGAIILALLAGAVAVNSNKTPIDTTKTPADGAATSENIANQNKSKFLFAVQTNNRTLAEQMIQAGVNPNTEFEYIGGLNALSLAARDGSKEMVIFLLSHGATQLNQEVEATLSPEIKRIIATYKSTGGRNFYLTPKAAGNGQ